MKRDKTPPHGTPSKAPTEPTARLYLTHGEKGRVADLCAFGLRLMEGLVGAKVVNAGAAGQQMTRHALAYVSGVDAAELAVEAVEVVYLPEGAALPPAGRWETVRGRT